MACRGSCPGCTHFTGNVSSHKDKKCKYCGCRRSKHGLPSSPVKASVDRRGVRRGKCTTCSCSQYVLGDSHACGYCGHFPTEHITLSGMNTAHAPNFGGSNATVQPSPKHQDGMVCKMPNCGNPVFVDPATGKVHEFCGIKHSRAWSAMQPAEAPTYNSRPPAGVGTCKLPGCNKPRNEGFDYCCKNHGRQDSARIASIGRCKFRGCQQLRHVKPNGDVMEYCSKTHAQLGTRQQASTSMQFQQQQFQQQQQQQQQQEIVDATVDILEPLLELGLDMAFDS